MIVVYPKLTYPPTQTWTSPPPPLPWKI